MYPTDVTKLEKLLWAYYDAADALKQCQETHQDTNQAGTTHALAVMALLGFVNTHRIELFDLIERGRSDDSIRQYEDGKPYCWSDDLNRPLTVREYYHGTTRLEDTE
jgi:hypothetical protein